MNISVEVRAVMCEAKKKVASSQTAEELIAILTEIIELLNCTSKSSASSIIGIEYTETFKTEFLKNHYSNFCEHLLRSMSATLLEESKQFSLVLQKLFLSGPAQDSFLVLASVIPSTKHTAVLSQIVTILNQFASRGKFVELFVAKCRKSSAQNSYQSSQDLLQLLVSLPEQLANKLKLSMDANFHPNTYYKMLGGTVLNALEKVHELASNSQQFTTTFLSNFVGKVALRGSLDVLLDKILPQLKKWSYSSPLWANLCSQVLMEVPVSSLEPVLECLLKKITHYPFFSKLVKDSICTNPVFKMLITHKFLFLRYYKDLHVLENIIGYLCGSDRRTFLIDTAKKLMSHWGNVNTIKHSSHPQHYYITQAVILSIVQANGEEVAKHKDNFLQMLLTGVQAHLENPNKQIRQLGMITAECVTSFLHQGGQQLKFEYDENKEIGELRKLAASPKFDVDLERQNFMDKPSLVEKMPSTANKVTDSNNVGKNKEKSADLEDDDDLKPFEMNENDDDLIEGIQPPRYLSECIDGLMASDDHKRYIASLTVLNKVIQDDKDNLPRLSVQLLTILLHLQDKYALEDYIQLRFISMVSVTVNCPVQASGYLTKEFYAPNYTLRQRMDILDVLAAAATKLSKPQSNVGTKQSSEYHPKDGKVKDWQLVIQERVEKKTRRFGKKVVKTGPRGTVNRFALVAGSFLFPLLQGFDGRQNTFNLLGEDCMVLGHLVCTLGNIMYCARGTPIACNMAKCLLEFVWVMRYHDNSHVRQALLFALAMTVLSVPSFFVVQELHDELGECQNWLENVLANDPSAECRNLAMQVLVSVRDVFKKEFNCEQMES